MCSREWISSKWLEIKILSLKVYKNKLLLKGDTQKRVEFDEIILVGTGDKLLLTCFIDSFYLIDKDGWLTNMYRYTM